MKRCIITGATSFIAVPLLKRLLEENYYIYAIVRPGSINIGRMPYHQNLCMIQLDMKEIEQLSDYVIEPVDSFYHFAWDGIRGVQREDEKLQQSNYLNTKKTIETAAKIGTSVFLCSGSQAEYGIKDGKITEAEKENPVTAYGKYKLKSKNFCEVYAKDKKIRFIWGRIFSAYGKYDYQKSLIMDSIEKMKKNEEILLSVCEQNWNYTYVEDVALAFWLFAEKSCESGVYNIASTDTRKLKAFLLELKEIMNSSSMLKFGAISPGRNGLVSMEPDAGKMEQALKCQLNTDFNTGIKKMLEIY